MKTRKKTRIYVALVALCAVCLSSCAKLETETTCDYKTPTTQKGIIIVNPDKIVK